MPTTLELYTALQNFSLVCQQLQSYTQLHKALALYANNFKVTALQNFSLVCQYLTGLHLYKLYANNFRVIALQNFALYAIDFRVTALQNFSLVSQQLQSGGSTKLQQFQSYSSTEQRLIFIVSKRKMNYGAYKNVCILDS